MLNKIQKTIICSVVVFFINAGVVDLAIAKVSKSSNKTVITKRLSKKSKAKEININSATFETLQKIRGISKTKAKAIIDYRSEHGRFKNIEELLKIKCRGIHEKWLKKVSKFLQV